MADVIKRLKYYKNQFLQEPDFTAEQEYHLDRQRRHNRQLHTPGIAHGLTVTVGTSSVVVAPGTAIDDQGRQIVLHEPRTVGFEDELDNNWVLVVISYEQVESDVATVGDVGDRGPTRFTEVPKIDAILDDGNAPPAGERIRLARLQLDGIGAIINQDMNVRNLAGPRLRPEETLERLKLSRQGVPDNQWPVLSSGAAGRADVTGDLNVTSNITAANLTAGNLTAGNLTLSGNIVVNGTVDGRDISADATANLAHHNNTNNPHAVTALQVGAITGVGGVVNAGGPVNLQAGNNIAITPDNGANKRITIASSTIEGVSNPGGNINFVGQGGISVSGDNGFAKQVTITTSLDALGAFPAGDYLRRYSSGAIWFSQGNLNFASEPVSAGFQPRLVWVTGRAYANVASSWVGGTVSGFAQINSQFAFAQRGFGPYAYRSSSAVLTTYGMSTNTAVAIANLEASGVSVTMKLEIINVTGSGFTLRYNRSFNGAAAPSTYLIEVYVTCLG